MNKFHISGQEVKPCEATKRNCPLGGEHFDSMEEGYQALASQGSASLGKSYTYGVSPFKGASYYGLHIEPAHVQSYLDELYLTLGEEALAFEEAKALRDGMGKYHLTVLTPADVRSLSKPIETPLKASVEYVGLGSAVKGEHQAWYIVCRSAELDAWRAGNDLPPHDFHITLAFRGKDVHGVPKGLATLV